MKSEYVLLFNGLLSAFLAFLSYSFSIHKHKKDLKNTKILDLQNTIKSCYEDISTFIEEYLGTNENENIKKRVSREKIDFKIESIRERIEKYHYGNLQSDFGNFSIKISDTTFETDEDKCINNLGIIKKLVIDINKELENIRG